MADPGYISLPWIQLLRVALIGKHFVGHSASSMLVRKMNGYNSSIGGPEADKSAFGSIFHVRRAKMLADKTG